ncbi:MAG: hypothetical protein GXP31_06670 [Kiritimatiellaeota bacterium]|nr:hypothetical protein [Kiritimatiellota bacterium]
MKHTHANELVQNQSRRSDGLWFRWSSVFALLGLLGGCVLAAAASAGSGDPAGVTPSEVVDWQVRAMPATFRPEAAKRATKMFAARSGSILLQRGLSAKLRPAVLVVVKTTVRSPRGRTLGFWPGVREIRLFRAGADVSFRRIQTVPAADIHGKTLPLAGRPYSRRNEWLRDSVFCLVDFDAPLGKRSRYRVEVMWGESEQRSVSGTFDTPVLGRPRCFALRAPDGAIRFKWETQFPGRTLLDASAKAAVAVPKHFPFPFYDPFNGKVDELLRFSFDEAKGELPVGAVAWTGRSSALVLGAYGVVSCREWSLLGGETVCSRRVGTLVLLEDKNGAPVKLGEEKRGRPRTTAQWCAHIAAGLGWPGNDGVQCFLRLGKKQAGSGALYPKASGPLLKTVSLATGAGTANLECPIPQIPASFRVEAHPDGVLIRWTSTTPDPSSYATPPTVVVHRISGRRVLTGKAVTGNYLLSGDSEIARVPVSKGEYLDRTSAGAAPGFYALTVEEVRVVTLMLPDGQVLRRTLPIRVAIRDRKPDRSPGNNAPWLWVPAPGRRAAGPVRVAIIRGLPKAVDSHFRDSAKRLYVVPDAPETDAVFRSTRKAVEPLTWVSLQERENAAALIAEWEQGGRHAPRAGEVEVILACFSLHGDDGTFPSVALIDIRNRKYRLAAQADGVPFDPTALGAQVVKSLREYFPRRCTVSGAKNGKAVASIRVAFPGIRLVNPGPGLTDLAPGLADLISVRLSKIPGLSLIERKDHRVILRELALDADFAGSDSLKNVSAQGADAVLWVDLSGNRDDFSMRARSASVHSGVLSLLADVHGTSETLDKTVERLTAGIVRGIGRAAAGKRPPEFLAKEEAELEGSVISTHRHTAARRKILIEGPTPETLAVTARRKLRRGQPEAAYSDFMEAVRLARKDHGEVARYYLGAEAALKKLGRNEKRLSLWKQAASSQPVTSIDRDRVYLGYAACLIELDRKKEASAVLRKVSTRDYADRVAELFLAAGDESAAIEKRLRARWSPNLRSSRLFRPIIQSSSRTPHYRAVVEALDTADIATHRRILDTIAKKLAPCRPVQALKAAALLRALGGSHYDLAAEEAGALSCLADVEELRALAAKWPATPKIDPRGLVLLPNLVRMCRKTNQQGIADKLLRAARTTEVGRRMARVLDRAPRAEPAPAGPTVDALLSGPAREYLGNGGGRKLGGDVLFLSPAGTLARLSPDLAHERWTSRVSSLPSVFFPEAGKGNPKLKEEGVSPEKQFERLNRLFCASPTVVVVSDCALGRILGFDPETGRKLWAFSAWSTVSPPVLLREKSWVFVLDAWDVIHRLDVRSGKELQRMRCHRLSSAGIDDVPDMLWRADQGYLLTYHTRRSMRPGCRGIPVFLPRDPASLRKTIAWPPDTTHSGWIRTNAVPVTGAGMSGRGAP